MTLGNKTIDITGQRFERLTVVKYAGKNKYGKAMWECKCDCGKTTIVLGRLLRSGSTKSCGCYSTDKLAEYSKARMTTHRESKTRLYRIWEGMRQRCRYKKCANYPNYGGRGITVCDEWEKSYLKFREWALENGYRDDLSIDRIDNDSGYSPSNCRWADRKTQSRNCSRNIVITYNGETHCLIDWAAILNLNYRVMRARIVDRGWEPSKAFETPYKKSYDRKNELIEFNGETRTVKEWAEAVSVPYGRLRIRIFNNGWSIEKALTTPFRNHKEYAKRKL